MTFGLGGATYEIDLNDKNAAKLEKALAPFIEAGRKVGKTATPRGKKSSGGPSAAEVRDWALANGHDVPARGRIPAGVREAYDAVH
ncbi:Lsr2 family protein [Nocardioides zeae]|nr:Lsr2 family protein [Nocardioides zeae]